MFSSSNSCKAILLVGVLKAIESEVMLTPELREETNQESRSREEIPNRFLCM
jgi:hypothetical protein